MGKKIYILGIAGTGPTGFDISGLGHDPSACLIKDGVPIAMAEEERFTRIKHAPGLFPYNAIKFCLDYAKITLDDVSYITGYVNPKLFNKNIWKKRMFLRPVQMTKFLIGNKIIKMKYNECLNNIPLKFGQSSDVSKKICFVEHHLAHASSSFHVSGFKDASIISIDGAGEFSTTLLAHGQNGNIKKIMESYSPNSAGGFYTSFTEYLGFKPNDGEYKLMGLAPYGKPNMVGIDNSINVVSGQIVVDKNLLSEKGHSYSSYHMKFGKPRIKNGEITEHHKNIAFAVQQKYEDIVFQLLDFVINETDCKNLCIAGGCGLNSKANGKISASGLIDDIFIQPASNDAGTSLGSALYKYHDLGYKSNYVMNNCYFGPEYTNEQIKEVLDASKIRHEWHDDISGICAELVSKEKIIGWFQGRMEFGPRALGSRTILADSRNPNMKELVNKAIKFREGFRPFCPSMLVEAGEEYLENYRKSPFMILTFQVKEGKAKEIPAVVHVDNSVRPQTVEKHINPLYYKMIKEFEKLSSVPVVMNTSFNIADEPIVCTPKDAIRTFYSSGIDYLAIGNYLVRK